MKINWQFLKRKWWKILALGALVAVGIVFFPQAECALAQTCNGPRDVWCAGGSADQYCCTPSTGYWAVDSCRLDQYNYCHEEGPGITEGKVPLRCNNVDGQTCWINEIVGASYRARFSNRLVQENGRWYWYVGGCRFQTCTLDTRANKHLATCCVHDDAPPCTPSFRPPSIDTTFTTWPQNPLVWGQDETQLGLTLHGISAHGGQDTACNSGRQDITSITVQLRLTDASKQWIETYLSSRYYISNSRYFILYNCTCYRPWL